MSIQTEITRLQGLRNALRTKLVALGLATSSADLEDCVTAVEGVENRGAGGRRQEEVRPRTVDDAHGDGRGDDVA